VRESLGEHYDDNFRIWFNDNADHIGPRTPRLVQSEGIVQQALRDVSAWAERGTAPARSTRYAVVDSQVGVAKNATVRLGIQPVVDLTVNGSNLVDVAAGQPVTFAAKIEVPPEAGKIVDTEWDFTGTGDMKVRLPFGEARQTVEESVTLSYSTPGTYFPTLRATAQREGDPSTPFAKIENMGRVRVVVHQAVAK
jgi:hypothetical protein